MSFVSSNPQCQCMVCTLNITTTVHLAYSLHIPITYLLFTKQFLMLTLQNNTNLFHYWVLQGLLDYIYRNATQQAAWGRTSGGPWLYYKNFDIQWSIYSLLTLQRKHTNYAKFCLLYVITSLVEFLYFMMAVCYSPLIHAAIICTVSSQEANWSLYNTEKPNGNRGTMALLWSCQENLQSCGEPLCLWWKEHIVSIPRTTILAFQIPSFGPFGLITG